jgi:hypothetical protein
MESILINRLSTNLVIKGFFLNVHLDHRRGAGRKRLIWLLEDGSVLCGSLVTKALRVLTLWMEREDLHMWRVTANILNKQSPTAEKG